MALTAGSVFTKISEVRSKLAVYEALSTHLLTMYITREDERNATLKIPPEIVLQREDYAAVPEDHIIYVIDEINELIAALKAELTEWETMPLAEPKEAKPAAKGAKKSNGKAEKTDPKKGTADEQQAGSQREDSPSSEEH